MSIKVRLGDITRISCDAIVNPANSFGYMGGGVAGALKRVGGKQIEKEAVKKAPIPVGNAIVTTGGNLPSRYVIHAPTMQKPAMVIPLDNVKRATRAALSLAKKLKLSVVVLPGMGTGVGGVSYMQAAEAIVSIAKEYQDEFEQLILMDRNQEMIDAFHRFL
jgi:O-acetyl-ADP-ribose deacetylase (regulator of RNase III)